MNSNIVFSIFWIICGLISAIISKIQSRSPDIEDMSWYWYIILVLIGPIAFLINLLCIENKQS